MAQWGEDDCVDYGLSDKKKKDTRRLKVQGVARWSVTITDVVVEHYTSAVGLI